MYSFLSRHFPTLSDPNHAYWGWEEGGGGGGVLLFHNI